MEMGVSLDICAKTENVEIINSNNIKHKETNMLIIFVSCAIVLVAFALNMPQIEPIIPPNRNITELAPMQIDTDFFHGIPQE